MGLTMTPVTAAAMSAVAVDKAGRRLGGPELGAPGRRVARDRGDGCDRRGRLRLPDRASTTRCGSARCCASSARPSRCWPFARSSIRTRRPSRRWSRPHDAGAGEAADCGGTAAGGARHRLPRLLAVELPRRDDGGDRARGGHLGADPVPPLRLEARPVSRVPRRGVGELPRGLRGGDRGRPRQVPRRDRGRLHGEAAARSA